MDWSNPRPSCSSARMSVRLSVKLLRATGLWKYRVNEISYPTSVFVVSIRASSACGKTSRRKSAFTPPSSTSGICSVSRFWVSGSYSTTAGLPSSTTWNRPSSASASGSLSGVGAATLRVTGAAPSCRVASPSRSRLRCAAVQYVVGDAPNEADDGRVLTVLHCHSSSVVGSAS